MDLQVGGTTKFNVRKDGQGYFAGNVGIGTTGPAAKLHVAGGAAAVDADQKVSLKGAASSNDTYMVYDSVSGKMWMYVNGQKVAWFKD